MRACNSQPPGQRRRAGARLADFALAMYLPTAGITMFSSAFLASRPRAAAARRNSGAIFCPDSRIRRENGLGIARNLAHNRAGRAGDASGLSHIRSQGAPPRMLIKLFVCCFFARSCWRWPAPARSGWQSGISAATCRITSSSRNTSRRSRRAFTPAMAACWPSTRPSAGFSCRSRPFRSVSSTRSCPPRTRTSTRHRGVDPISILRAALTDLGRWGSDRRPVGASTITQQVAKNMLLSGEVSIRRKIREALLATRIEQALSKDRILELYLNEIYLGSGAYGVVAAALTYFNKSLDELTLDEAAYLAGLPKSPEQLQSGPLSPGGESAARLGPRPHRRGRRRERRGNQGGEGRAARGCGAARRPRSCRRPILPRKSGANCWPGTARRPSMKAASRCAPVSTRRCRQPPTRRCAPG